MLILNSLFIKSTLLLTLFILVCSPILFMSSMRRIHDAGFATPLAVLPLLVFWLSTFTFLTLESSLKWLFIVFAILTTLIAAALSNARIRRNYQYILGYSGPIDLSNVEEEISPISPHERVEPTLSTGVSDNLNIQPVKNKLNQDIYQEKILSKESLFLKNKLIQKICDWFTHNLKLVGIIMAAIFTLILLITFLPEKKQDENKVIEPSQSDNVKQRNHKVKMPDGFWLMIDQYKALTIGWQGELINQKEIWSAMTAQGDKSCVELVFNQQIKFRSMRVEVKGEGDYYADFSPVDSKEMVQSIAKLNQFNLCGYSFSLKGTQAKLMLNSQYASYLE